MTPRELDALVAEKVMGWIPCTDHNGAQKCFYRTEGERDHELGRICHFASHFSTDPAASKQLREKLADLYSRIQMVITRNGVKVAIWLKRHPRGKRGSNWDLAHAEADTEEMCVALCALKSVGIEGER